MKSKENLIGAWAFLIGVILAVAIGLFNPIPGTNASTIAYAFLVVLGFVVGILNVADKDSMTFLIAAVSLVVVSGFGQQTLIFISNINPILSYLNTILSALLVMFVPATILVALKAVFSISS
jgi:hypothetical protein